MRTIIASTLILVGCAAPAQEFRPTNMAGRARSGEPAALYDVREDSQRLAQVVVWSQGAYLAENQSGTVIHVAVEVQNVGTVALSFDTAALEIQAFDDQGAPLPAPRLISIQPPGADTRPIAARTAQDFDLYFVLSPQIAPEAIGSMRLRWGLARPEGRKYVQFTEFTKDVPRVDGYAYGYVPIYGFYDPFLWYPYPRVIVTRHHVHVRKVVVPSRPRRYR